MPDPFVGEVTRPTSFTPSKDYALVVARGLNDAWLGDYDLLDLQKILRFDLASFSAAVLRDGAVLFETGGTIADPVPGVNLGADSLGAGGTYRGVESQLYTVTITMGGQPGTAAYTYRSTGSDNPDVGGTSQVVTAIAPDLATALAAPGTYGHPVGTLGVLVFFINPNGFLTVGNSWIVQVTYGARPPVVSGEDITIADILVPVRGRIHRVAGATLTYPPASSGSAIVYGEWSRTLITHADDPDLRDPLSDTPQAWRERWRVVLRNTDTSALPLGVNELERRVFPLYRWDRATDVVTPVIRAPYAIDINRTEGALNAERLLNVDQSELLKGFQADLDAGAHGSYVVNPAGTAPRAAISTNAPAAGKIRLILPPIRARLSGVPIRRTDPTELEVDQATDVGTVTDEPHTYQAANNPFLLNKATGSPTFPIKQVTQLTATVQIGTLGTGGYEAVTRSTGTAFDNVAQTPLVSILRISNTQGGAENYTQGVNYQLTGNQIEWLTGAPGDGATYYVAYRYSKVMVSGTDFALTSGAIDFSVGGDDPVEGTVFEVDYEFYLPRHDAIVLRPNGALAIIRGLPAEEPDIGDIPQFTLPYVRVEIPANIVNVRLRPFPNQAVTMETLNLVLDALGELTQNLARQDLTNQARVQTSANFLDILADEFATTDFADLTYNVGGVAFDATIDTEVEELTLPFTPTLAALEKIAAPGSETDVRVGGAFVTLPYTDELAIDAPKFSESYPINPYADFRPEPPAVHLEPSQDLFSDTATITSTRVRTIQNGRHIDGRIVRTFTRVRERTVSEVAATFMRQIPIILRGFHFVPGEKIRLKFDGKDVQLTALAPTQQGGDAFTVIARASDASHLYGDVTAEFTVPANVRAGTAAVEVYGDEAVPASVWPGDYSVRARLTYTSQGVQRTVAVETIIIRVQNDPIAQSVIFSAPRMLSRVDLPLAQKPANLGPALRFEVRATDRSGRASTPIDDVLGFTVKEPVDLTVGIGSLNQMVLPDPVLCPADEFRTFVLRSPSNAYRAYVAQLGGPDRTAGGFIQEQQIPSGIFLDSSNNVDWTLRQGWDLRCKVYVAKMSALEARLYYDRVSVANMTGFFLNPDQVVPDGTSIEWQYSTDGLALGNGSKVWTTFFPFTVTELPTAAATLDLRAILRSDDPYLTPAVHRYNASVLVQVNKLAGKYVAKQKLLTAGATIIKGGVEFRTPPGGTQTVYVSVDDGATWSQATLSSAGAAAGGFTAFTYEKTGLASGTKLRVRVDQDTPNRALRPRARRLYAYAEPA
jgi:hypothetical protein